MKLRKLCEEFVDYVKASSYSEEAYEIIKNPTSKEKRDLSEEVRFIIDFKNKIFYVFDSELLHSFAAKELGIPYRGKGSENYYFGTGINLKIKPKILTYISKNPTELSYSRILELRDENSWVRKYLEYK